MRISTMLALTSLSVGLCGLTACGKTDPGAGTTNAVAESTADVESPIGNDVVIEKHEGGSVAFHVAADGSVKAAVTVDGKLKSDVTGSLGWKDGAEAKAIPLAADAKTKLLVAAGPKLSADLTEIGYTLAVDGKPWSGTLHIPAGGTAALVTEANANASAVASVSGKLGPHGGSIQIVGQDRLEIVANAAGDLRVYVLGPDLAIQAVGDRRITIALVAEAPQVVVLVPEPGGLYLTGKLQLKEDPIKVTIAMRANAKAEAHCTLVGFRPGMHFAVDGTGVARVKIKVKAEFDESIDADARAKLKADLRGPNVNVKLPDAKAKAEANIKPPSVDVHVPKPEAKASAKAGAGAGTGAKAGAKAGVKFGF